MKLILVGRDKNQPVPPEYRLLKLTENNLSDLDQVTNNSCEEIICEEIFENSPNDKFMELAQRIFTKMRLDGSILFTGIDLDTLIEHYQINLINEEYFNKVVFSKKSIISVRAIISMARQFGLNIVSLDRQGFVYKLILSRIS